MKNYTHTGLYCQTDGNGVDRHAPIVCKGGPGGYATLDETQQYGGCTYTVGGSSADAAFVKAARDALDRLTDFQATAIMRDRADAMAPCDQQTLGDLISRSAHMRDRANTPNTFREIEGGGE